MYLPASPALFYTLLHRGLHYVNECCFISRMTIGDSIKNFITTSVISMMFFCILKPYNPNVKNRCFIAKLRLQGQFLKYVNECCFISRMTIGDSIKKCYKYISHINDVFLHTKAVQSECQE